MNIEDSYEPSAGSRLAKTLLQLAQHDLSRWVLTGGTAIELHLHRRNAPTLLRPSHDLDFIAANFACLPETLGEVLLLRHVHPNDPPAKCILQAVHPETVVRVDVFRSYGSEIERASDIELNGVSLRLVAFEDLVARHARLCGDILRGQTLAPKFARDFLRMLDLVEPEQIEAIWQEHRKSQDPLSFAEVSHLLCEAITIHKERLIPLVYSTDPTQICPRCESTPAFKLASSQKIFSLLGYC